MFNATKYEFDVFNHSAPGTVVFEALLLLENPSDVVQVIIDFQRATQGNTDTFNISETVFGAPFDMTILLNIALRDVFTPSADPFELEALVIGINTGTRQVIADVILHVTGNECC